MAHLLYSSPSKDRDGLQMEAADVAPSLHYGPPLMNHKEMLDEISKTTKRELEKLEQKLKSDVDVVDRTVHFKKQFFTTASFRLHYPTWLREMSRILFPLQYLATGTDKRGAWLFIFLWSVLNGFIAVGIINYLGATWLPEVLARFFDKIELTSAEFWTPAILYVIFGVVVSTQASIWTIGGAADKKRFQKLEKMKILHYFPEGNNVITLNAREVALAILRKGALFKGDFAQFWKTIAVSALISALYLSIPFFYARLRPHASSAAPFSLTGLGSFLAISFKFVLSSIVLTELITSLLNLYERLVLLRTFSDITSRRRAAKRHLPYIKLYTPENIVCWQAIREYVMAHHEARLVWFQVLTAFGTTYIGFVALTLALRFWYKDPFGLSDIQGFFVILVGGIYALVVIFIGAMADAVQRSHVKILMRQKWKLQRHLLQYEDVERARKLSFDEKTDPQEALDRLLFGDDKGDEGSEIDIDSDDDSSEEPKSPTNKKRRLDSFQTPPPRQYRAHQSSPLSPIALTTPMKGREQEIAQECQKLLSRLIKVLELTDQPLRLLGVLKVDMSLAIKVAGILISVLISRVRSLFS